MITIDQLNEKGFFEAIPKLKELAQADNITEIYISPPIAD